MSENTERYKRYIIADVEDSITITTDAMQGNKVIVYDINTGEDKWVVIHAKGKCFESINDFENYIHKETSGKEYQFLKQVVKLIKIKFNY